MDRQQNQKVVFRKNTRCRPSGFRGSRSSTIFIHMEENRRTNS